MTKVLKPLFTQQQEQNGLSYQRTRPLISSCKPTPCYSAKVHVDFCNQYDMEKNFKNSIFLRRFEIEIWFNNPSQTINYKRLDLFSENMKNVEMVKTDFRYHNDLSRATQVSSKNIQKNPTLIGIEFLLSDTGFMSKMSMKSIFDSLARCPKIAKISLKLDHCEWLSNGHVLILAEGLKKVKGIVYLNLAMNENLQIEHEGEEYLYTSLAKLEKLEHLSLNFENNYSMFSNNALNLLLKSLSKMKRLREFEFDVGNCNKIEFSGFQTIFQMISTFLNLEKLILSLNYIKKIDNCLIDEFFHAIVILPELAELHVCLLWIEAIGDETIQVITKNLSKMKKIQNLSLKLYNFNKISEESIVGLSKQTKMMPSLKSLHLALASECQDNFKKMFSHLNFSFEETLN